MGAFLKVTLPLVVIASALSGVAGYAYGVHSSRAGVGGSNQELKPSPTATASSTGDYALLTPAMSAECPSGRVAYDYSRPVTRLDLSSFGSNA